MNFNSLLTINNLWLSIGLLGQLMFSMRFIVQWLKSESQKKSVIPITFWYYSILGGIILLAYAIHRHDPVFILGQATGLLIYIRNLHLIRQERKSTKIEIATQ
jgi:lipid-A-disaccharide synthase-like uncharacterized protein